MSPAAYDRIAEPDTASSRFFVSLTTRLIAATMVSLVISLRLDIYVVAVLILRSVAASATIAVFVFAACAGLWFAFPLARRRQVL
jgi:hypothetical protein